VAGSFGLERIKKLVKYIFKKNHCRIHAIIFDDSLPKSKAREKCAYAVQ
jgi:hypothetical protein